MLHEWLLASSTIAGHPFHVHVNPFEVIDPSGERYWKDTLFIETGGPLVPAGEVVSWGQGWTIQSVSLAAYGEKSAQAMVAAVLTREVQKTASTTWDRYPLYCQPPSSRALGNKL